MSHGAISPSLMVLLNSTKITTNTEAAMLSSGDCDNLMVNVFQGLSFHTNSWPNDFKCQGKRLAVIGEIYNDNHHHHLHYHQHHQELEQHQCKQFQA